MGHLFLLKQEPQNFKDFMVRLFKEKGSKEVVWDLN